MNKEYEMPEHIVTLREIGLTITELYCLQNAPSLHSMKYWIKKVHLSHTR